MKFNLKNRPTLLHSHPELDEWFMGFDKELRDYPCKGIAIDCFNKGKLYGMRFLIKEILDSLRRVVEIDWCCCFRDMLCF